MDGVNLPVMLQAALAWMPLQAWDELSTSGTAVYSILIDNYSCNFMGNFAAFVNGVSLNGLAEVTNAQWANECVNVTFYNRDLVYDQDFYIKNRLSILPEATTPYHQPGFPSFADPVITTNEFIIEPNVNSNITAGEEIILGPGFIAKEGCNFTASINPSACTDGQRLVQQQPPQQVYYVRDETKAAAPSAQIATPQLAVVPNPSSGETTLQFSLVSPGKVTLVVTDMLGRVVHNEVNEVQSEPGNYAVPINIGNAAGVYACNLYVDGVLVDVERMVVK